MEAQQLGESGHSAEIGVFGGSGFYRFDDTDGAVREIDEVWIETPYGPPSDKVTLAEVHGRRVAFLPRHGRDHRYPPAAINYRANIWAMRALGVSHVIGPCAAGSLQPHIEPGHFVVTDQFVHRTWGRADTFFTGPIVTHISAADPYCPELREKAIAAIKAEGITVHERGTVVVVQGPRFSTRAESREFRAHGWDVINMTQYPEGWLAHELGMCYVNIALVTDYDVGLEDEPGIQPVTHQAVLEVFARNNERLRAVLFRVIAQIDPRARACDCSTVLQDARG